MGFSRQEYWSGLHLPSPEDLPDPGMSPAFQADYLPFELLKILTDSVDLNNLCLTNVLLTLVDLKQDFS